MTSSTRICVFVMAATLCLSHIASAGYIDCSMECLFKAFRQPTLCECKNTLKLHWGKRAPRTRSHTLPTFRYGKRASPFTNQAYFNDIDSDRLNLLRSIQETLQSDPSTGEYDV